MKRDLKWMLLGIFLAVASCWCLTAGASNLLFGILGFYILPIAAVITFATGFTEGNGSKSNEYPGDPEDTEPKEKSE